MQPFASRKSQIAIALALAGVMAIFLLLYYRYDPSSSIRAPKCVFKLLTGWDCPGCGSQRALHALLHGHILQALSLNPFVFIAVPAAVLFFIAEAGRRSHPRFYRRVINPASTTAVLVVTVLWWVGRNLIGH